MHISSPSTRNLPTGPNLWGQARWKIGGRATTLTHTTRLSLSRAACWPEKQQENIEIRRKGHYTAERESRYVRRLLKHFCRVPAVCSWSRFTTSISRSHKTPSTPAWRNPRPIWSHVGKSDQIESDSLLSSSSINCPRSIRWPHFLLVTPPRRMSYLSFFSAGAHIQRAKNAHTHFAFAIWMFAGGW